MVNFTNKIKGNKDQLKIYKIIFIWCVFFLTIAFLRHYTFHSNAWDLSIFDEAVWNTTQGNFMFTQLRSINFLSDHFTPIILIFVPFYFLGFGPHLLIFTQVVLVSLGALPIYWLTKDNIDNKKMQFLFPLAYLLFLPLYHAILFDFHPETLAIPFFLFAFYFLIKEKYSLFLLLLVAAMLCKENMNFVGAFLGLYMLFFRKEKILGLIIFVIGTFLFFFELQYLIPSMGVKTGSYMYFDRYSYLGSNLKEITSTLFLRPFYVLQHVLILDKILYFVLMTAAVSFLCFLSPIFMITIPIFAQNLFTTYAWQYSFHAQYNDGIIPFLFLSVIFGLKNLLNGKSENLRLRIIKYASNIMMFFIIISIVEFSLGYFLRYTFITKHTLFGHKLIKQIPSYASVSASSNVYPHLTHRKNMWQFPSGVGQADYIILETFDPVWPMEDKDYPAALDNLWKQKEFQKILGFIFLGEIRTPVQSKRLYQMEIDKLLKNRKYQVLENNYQFIIAKKIK